MTELALAQDIWDLIDEWLDVYVQNVRELVGDGAPLSAYPDPQRKEIYAIARGAAFDSHPRFTVLKNGWDARMSQGQGGRGGMPKAESLPQKIGAALLGKLGNISQTLLSEGDDDDDGDGNGRRGGFTGILSQLADMVDIIYPDDVMAFLFGMRDSGVSTARNTIKNDGYTIECIKGSEVGDTLTKRSWYRVVARPVPVDPRKAVIQGMFPNASPEQIDFLIKVFDK